MFVDKNNPSQITTIIDWQAVSLYPMFLAAHHPSLIDHDGPKLSGFKAPVLPKNLKEMSPADKKVAKDLYLAQSLWILYEINVQKQAPDLVHAFRYKQTLPCQILGRIATIFEDGEPLVQSLLADLAQDDMWKRAVGTNGDGSPTVPCPLQYSKSELKRQEVEYAKWEKDIEPEMRVIEELGVYPGWNGAIDPTEYEEICARLARSKERFLEREAKTPMEREAWEKVWPFEDK